MYKFFYFETHYFQTMIRNILLFLKQNIVSVFYRLQYFSSSSAILPSNRRMTKMGMSCWEFLLRRCRGIREEEYSHHFFLTAFFTAVTPIDLSFPRSSTAQTDGKHLRTAET